MRSDYEKIFKEVYSRVIRLGGRLVKDTCLCAEFILPKDWQLLLKGEKVYAPAFSLILLSPSGDEFEIRLIMKAFEAIYDKNYGLPTIEREFDFLEQERLLVFEDINLYKKKYKELLLLEI